MSFQTLLYEVRDGIAIVTVNRPDKLNALNDAVIADLDQAVARIEADDAFACDRSLRADAFAAATGYRAPSWGEMLDELAEEVRAREKRE